MKLTKDVIYKYFPVNKSGEYKHRNSYVFDIADGKEYLYDSSSAEFEDEDEGDSYFDAIEVGQDVDMDWYDGKFDYRNIESEAKHVRIVYPRRKGVPRESEIHRMYERDGYTPYDDWDDIYDTEHPHIEEE